MSLGSLLGRPSCRLLLCGERGPSWRLRSGRQTIAASWERVSQLSEPGCCLEESTLTAPALGAGMSFPLIPTSPSLAVASELYAVLLKLARRPEDKEPEDRDFARELLVEVRERETCCKCSVRAPASSRPEKNPRALGPAQPLAARPSPCSLRPRRGPNSKGRTPASHAKDSGSAARRVLAPRIEARGAVVRRSIRPGSESRSDIPTAVGTRVVFRQYFSECPAQVFLRVMQVRQPCRLGGVAGVKPGCFVGEDHSVVVCCPGENLTCGLNRVEQLVSADGALAVWYLLAQSYSPFVVQRYR